jgi:hypothetical protein
MSSDAVPDQPSESREIGNEVSMSQHDERPVREGIAAKVGAAAGITGVLVATLSLASDRNFWPFTRNSVITVIVGAVLLVLAFVGHFYLNKFGKPTVAAAFSLTAALGASLVVGAASANPVDHPEDETVADPPSRTRSVETTDPVTDSSSRTQSTTTPTTTTPVSYVEGKRFRITVSPTSYVDLDNEKVDLDGGPTYEFFYPGDINKHILFATGPNLFDKAKVSLIDSDTSDPAACESSTRPQKNSVSEYTMGDSLICFTTSENRLAMVTAQAFGASNNWDGVFDVVLFDAQ